jgi:hypothetical protein
VDMFFFYGKKGLWWKLVGSYLGGGKLFVGSSYWGNEAVFIPFPRIRVDCTKTRQIAKGRNTAFTVLVVLVFALLFSYK